MKLDLNIPVTGYDLAKILEGNHGTFLAQQGGQSFVVVAASGHSIKFGPKPIGRRYVEFGSPVTPDVWTVTQISNEDLSAELGTDAFSAGISGRRSSQMESNR